MLHGGLAVSSGKVWSGEVSALLVVVFDVETGEFGEADPQSTAAIIDVLTVQRLKQRSSNTRYFYHLVEATKALGTIMLTSLAAWADAPSGYCSRAWN